MNKTLAKKVRAIFDRELKKLKQPNWAAAFKKDRLCTARASAKVWQVLHDAGYTSDPRVRRERTLNITCECDSS